MCDTCRPSCTVLSLNITPEPVWSDTVGNQSHDDDNCILQTIIHGVFHDVALSRQFGLTMNGMIFFFILMTVDISVSH